MGELELELARVIPSSWVGSVEGESTYITGLPLEADLYVVEVGTSFGASHPYPGSSAPLGRRSAATARVEGQWPTTTSGPDDWSSERWCWKVSTARKMPSMTLQAEKRVGGSAPEEVGRRVENRARLVDPAREGRGAVAEVLCRVH